MARFHSLNDSLQLFVAGVVEATFASSQENVAEIGSDDWGERRGSEGSDGGNKWKFMTN